MVMDDDKDPGIKKSLLQWLLGQESNTVALYLLFASIMYGGYLAATVVVPSQLKMMNDGREKDANTFTKIIEQEGEKNREAHKEIADRHYASIRDMSENFKVTLKDAADHHDKILESFQRVFERVNPDRGRKD